MITSRVIRNAKVPEEDKFRFRNVPIKISRVVESADSYDNKKLQVPLKKKEEIVCYDDGKKDTAVFLGLEDEVAFVIQSYYIYIKCSNPTRRKENDIIFLVVDKFDPKT
ncbi:hypothetical protein DBV15_10976 [Temnothorax longispinosus]|uniref:Uncharacterized protein n=1 Tax=Temnothorax longispinosus TaxID=300112 RepID=A0A4V6RGQ6_9HYME|nr:hypothetical protein DBV15_10976 [Temnothorax longispinosus]